MNLYLTKISYDLKEHQSRSVDKLMESKGVILNHSTGSGKTMTILEAIRRVQELDDKGKSKQLIITPASLTTNIQKEMIKHDMGIDPSRVETISYDKAVNDLMRLSHQRYSLVSLDEAHKLRNTGTKRFSKLQNLIGRADYRMLATATPIYNSPSDISPLINLVSGDKLLPTDRTQFERKYVTMVAAPKKGLLGSIIRGPVAPPTLQIKNRSELQQILRMYVDSYNLKDDPSAKDHFPSSEQHTIQVQMSQDQEKVYKYLENDIPFLIRMKIRNNLPLDKKESAALNAFSTGVRQASNSIRPYVTEAEVERSPKIKRAVQELVTHAQTTPNFKAVVYSNYLKAGLEDYSDALMEHGVNHTLYHGGLSKKAKDDAVNDYNSGKVPVLLISSSGAEGLDLKGTKLMQVLEPHFNNSKIQQVTGRGIRYNSHEHLPKEERHVVVQHYLSTFPPGILGKSMAKTIDQYLKDNSLGKDVVTEKINDLLKDDK